VSDPSPSSHSHDGMAKSVNQGLAWIGAASSLVGILDIVATLLILNFWVTPDEYGIAVKCIWIFPILDQATDLGLSAAVIQGEKQDENTVSTVFWLNLAVALVLFLLIVVLSPLASAFYGHAIVGSMLIVYGTKLIWQNAYFMPVAMMKRELRFKELSVIRIIANLAEFGAKIGFAAAGFGIWCFVLGPLARVLVTGIGAQLRHPWRPKFVLKLRETRSHVMFGLKTSASQLLFYVYTNLDFPIVGYFFGNYWLGIYKLATEIVLEPVRIISAVVVDVAFPAFAKLRHKPERLVQQLISFTRLNIITVMMYSAVVFVAAHELLEVAFPDYIESAPVIRILCAVAVVRAVSFMLPPLLDGVGHPQRTFVYTLVATIVLPALFVVAAIVLGDSLGMMSVAVAWAIGYPIAFAVLLWLTVYSIDWSVAAYLRSIGGVMACMIGGALVGGAVHWAIDGFEPVVRLVATGAAIVLSTGSLLAYTQGISIRSMMRSMKDPVPVETPPVGVPTVKS
jgi:O-antigen/teichoic acid export membrane protein